MFPDYRAGTTTMAANADGVLWFGHISVTFAGELLGIAPTHREACVPAFCQFEFRDGTLLRERFFFDLNALCDGLGIDVGRLSGALAGLRAAAA